MLSLSQPVRPRRLSNKTSSFDRLMMRLTETPPTPASVLLA